MPSAIIGLFLRLAIWVASSAPFLVAWMRRQGGDNAITAGVLAILTMGVFLGIEAWQTRGVAIRPLRFAFGTAALAMCALTRGTLPLAIAGIFPGLAALWYFSNPRNAVSFPAPLLGLLLLGLPSARMLDVVAGYPLRAIATRMAATLLTGIGAPVTRHGMELSWDETPVWVDAPCAGIQMLLAALWLVFALAKLNRLGWFRTAIAGIAGVIVTVIANAARIAILTATDGYGMILPPALHSAIGFSALLGGAALCAFTTAILSHLKVGTHPDFQTGTHPIFDHQKTGTDPKFQMGTDPVFACQETGTHPVYRMGTDPDFWHGKLMYVIGIAIIATSCAIAPILGNGRGNPPIEIDEAVFPGWLAEWDGMALEEMPLTDREAGFAMDFPGKVARFRQGDGVVILRWVTAPSQRVHSGADCLMATGWRVKPRPLERRTDGDWSCFLAERNDVHLNVRERCIECNGGNIWPDVAAWFWDALLNRTQGPWWVITIVNP